MATQETEPIEAVLEDRRIAREKLVELEEAMHKFSDLLTGTTMEERGYKYYSWQRIYQLIDERVHGVPKASEPACPFHIGQQVEWDGQQGVCTGAISNITEPFPGIYVLWIGNAEEGLPINSIQVRKAAR